MFLQMLFPVAAQSKEWVRGRSLAGMWVRILSGHGYLSLVNVVCFQVDDSAMGRSFVQGSLNDCVFMSLNEIRWNSNPPHIYKVDRQKSAQERKKRRKKEKRK